MTIATAARILPATPVFPVHGEDRLEDPLLQVGRLLAQTGYRFTTVTPDTHAVIMERAGEQPAKDLRDVFGWSRPFHAGLLPEPLIAALHAAGALELLADGRLRSRGRCSTVGDRPFLHSGDPT